MAIQPGDDLMQVLEDMHAAGHTKVTTLRMVDGQPVLRLADGATAGEHAAAVAFVEGWAAPSADELGGDSDRVLRKCLVLALDDLAEAGLLDGQKKHVKKLRGWATKIRKQ